MRPYKATADDVERFRSEREEFRLIYRCGDCVHVEPETLRCSLGYPNRALLESEDYLEKSGEFVFCKYFEVD